MPGFANTAVREFGYFLGRLTVFPVLRSSTPPQQQQPNELLRKLTLLSPSEDKALPPLPQRVGAFRSIKHPPPPHPCLLYSALRAIPTTLQEGSWPQLRLLPGLYTGNENIFIGGPGDEDYPPAAR